MEQDQTYSLRQLGLFENLTQASHSGKTYQALSHQIAAKILERSSAKCSAPMFQCLDLEDGQQQGWLEADRSILHGASLTRNISEWHSDAVASSLSQILEDNVQEKYYLSSTAAQGILRRAEKKGKQIPEPLLWRTDRQTPRLSGMARHP